MLILAVVDKNDSVLTIATLVINLTSSQIDASNHHHASYKQLCGVRIKNGSETNKIFRQKGMEALPFSSTGAARINKTKVPYKCFILFDLESKIQKNC